MYHNMLASELISMTLSFCFEYVFLCACTNKTSRRKLMFYTFVLKLILLNFLFDTYLPMVYGDSDIYLFLNPLVNVLSALLYVAFVRYCLQISWSKYAVVIMIAEFFTMICSFGPSLLVGWIFHIAVSDSLNFVNVLGWILGIFTCWAIVYFMRPAFEWLIEREIKHPIFWEIFLIVYVMGGTYMTIEASMKDGNGRRMYIYGYQTVSIIIVILVFVFSYFLLQKQHNRTLALENERLRMQKDRINDYYQSLKKQIEMTRKFRHDIANHVQTMELLLEIPEVRTQEAIGYTDALKEQCRALYDMRYCNHQLINAAIENKVKRCRENHIPVKIDMNSLCLGKIEEMDFLGLLFNLMDNAIESCLKIQNPEERYIKLECFEAAGQLILIITNPATEVIVREGKLMTTKKARAYHGVGMSIVTDIVKKYDGVMDVTFNKPEFSVRMNIPN